MYLVAMEHKVDEGGKYDEKRNEARGLIFEIKTNKTRPYTLPPSRGRVGRSGIAKNTLMFCWAGATMPKSLANQKCDGPTDRQTNRHGKF